jgi:DNA polymerase III alpha subunit
MGYDDYFLIVWDFIKYAKNNKILVGPGRGSAPGSLVAYCLGITEIDPIKYGLLFERFLNPERVSMPDIDVDFPDDKRDDVINSVSDDIISFDYPLPTYPNKLGISSKEYLSKLCKKGLEKRLKGTNNDFNLYNNRLEYELNIISKMGYEILRSAMWF